MAEKSTIEWCDSTFNPWIGCTKVSPGCDNCYAAAQDKFRGWTPEGWGGPRKRTGEDTWAKPGRWNERGFFECPDCGLRGDARAMGDVRPMESAGACRHQRVKSARRRVFCSSLADVFDNQVPPEWRVDLFRLIAATPNLDWLLLTKRIGNVTSMVREAADCAHSLPATPDLGAVELWCDAWLAGRPPANVWLGATVVNQEEADRDIPKLLATPARVRFLSMEPLLGPVDLHGLWSKQTGQKAIAGPIPHDYYSFVNWVIVGGESGPGARPMHPDWARSLRDQCAAAGVPFLFKQWGENLCSPVVPATAQAAHICAIGEDGRDWGLCKPRNEGWWALPPDASTWREVGELPVGVVEVRRVGKTAAGRLLDGVTHDGFPEVARG